jgi:hypothetical protein
VTQYYNNELTLSAANVISVTAGATTAAINAKMVVGGKISGVVTNGAAKPLANICVDVLDANTAAVVGSATTNASGQYTIGKLPATSYKVEFVDCGGAGYIAQYYNDQPSFAAANPVSVISGVATTAINATMVHS